MKEASVRSGYVDLLRAVAIVLVVVGHWLITALERRSDGSLAAPELMVAVPWTQWLTPLFQIMPVFFLAGGYAAAGSWSACRTEGGTAAGWIRGRALRMLLPTGAYLVPALGGLLIAAALGTDPALLGMIGWALAMQFWFLPVYLTISALTPWLYTLYRRWGLRPVAVTAVAAVAVDLVVRGADAEWAGRVGWLNYLLVWAVAYQLGFDWKDGGPATRRWFGAVLALGGAAGYAALVGFGPFPVSLVLVTGEEVSNTNPPSPAMLAWLVAQCGLCLLLAPFAEQALRSARRRRFVEPLGRVSMTLYLWHMVPVLAAGAAFYLTDLAPEPEVGSAAWWAWRPAWILVLAALFGFLLAVLRPVDALLIRTARWALPGAAINGAWRPPLLMAGLAATVWSLAHWAVQGLARDGSPDWQVVLAFVIGSALVGAAATRWAAAETREATEVATQAGS
ncbi:acyltransferase family protein [Kitasatospora sp. CB01950]|uniref:acyltransferase family protein n=1 Tax=Kitasatospora sp. CB01950 TaxID=1703930 RepID=UPI00130149B0|nr:acyltransferase [Kitasatospora sp. CB01950]